MQSSSDPSSYTYAILKALAEEYDFDLNTPYEELPEAVRNVILHGTDGKKWWYIIAASVVSVFTMWHLRD